EFYTLGAYATFAALGLAGANFFAAVLAAIACGAVLGALCEQALLRPLRAESIDTTMLVMIGVWIAMQNAELLIWGGVAKSIPHPFPTAPLVLGPVSIAPLRVFVLVLAAGLIVMAYLAIHRTRLGTAMRATFQDRDTAALMGVRIHRMHTVTFAFGSGLAAAAPASSASKRELDERSHKHLSQATNRSHRPRGPRSNRANWMSGAGRAVLAGLALTLPFWLPNPYFLHVAIMAGIFGVLALSLN